MFPAPRLPRRLGVLALAAVLCLAGAASIPAQTTNGSVAGSVKDTQGGVLPGATVTLTSNSQGTGMTAVTDELGNFFFPYVRPDRYTLKISLPGFTTQQGAQVIVNAAGSLVWVLHSYNIREQLPQLRQLEWKRGPDRWTMIAATDFLARSFTWRVPGAGAARGLGMAALQAFRPAKSALARQMMFGQR